MATLGTETSIGDRLVPLTPSVVDFKVGLFSSQSRLGRVAQGVGSYALPGDTTTLRHPIRSGVYQGLTPGGGSGPGGRLGRRIGGGQMFSRCPSGFEFGGRFAGRNFSNCGRRVFETPGEGINSGIAGAVARAADRSIRSTLPSAPRGSVREIVSGKPSARSIQIARNASIPNVGPKNVAKRDAAVSAAANAVVGNRDSRSLLVRRDGITLSPTLSIAELTKLKSNKDMENGVFVTHVTEPSSLGKDEVPALLSTNLDEVVFAFPGGSHVKIGKNRDLSPTESRRLKGVFGRAHSSQEAMNYDGGIQAVIDASNGGLKYTGRFPGVKRPYERVAIENNQGQRRIVSRWVFEIFLSSQAPQRAGRTAWSVVETGVAEIADNKSLPMLVDHRVLTKQALFEYKTTAFLSDKEFSSYAFQVKRVAAIWDPDLPPEGGYRCPEGTRYGGRITDRFGRNCGWNISRRLANQLENLGRGLGNTLDDRRDRRMGRRLQRGQRAIGRAERRVQRVQGRLDGAQERLNRLRAANRPNGDGVQSPISRRLLRRATPEMRARRREERRQQRAERLRRFGERIDFGAGNERDRRIRERGRGSQRRNLIGGDERDRRRAERAQRRAERMQARRDRREDRRQARAERLRRFGERVDYGAGNERDRQIRERGRRARRGERAERLRRFADRIDYGAGRERDRRIRERRAQRGENRRQRRSERAVQRAARADQRLENRDQARRRRQDRREVRRRRRAERMQRFGQRVDYGAGNERDRRIRERGRRAAGETAVSRRTPERPQRGRDRDQRPFNPATEGRMPAQERNRRDEADLDRILSRGTSEQVDTPEQAGDRNPEFNGIDEFELVEIANRDPDPARRQRAREEAKRQAAAWRAGVRDEFQNMPEDELVARRDSLERREIALRQGDPRRERLAAEVGEIQDELYARILDDAQPPSESDEAENPIRVPGLGPRPPAADRPRRGPRPERFSADDGAQEFLRDLPDNEDDAADYMRQIDDFINTYGDDLSSQMVERLRRQRNQIDDKFFEGNYDRERLDDLEMELQDIRDGIETSDEAREEIENVDERLRNRFLNEQEREILENHARDLADIEEMLGEAELAQQDGDREEELRALEDELADVIAQIEQLPIEEQDEAIFEAWENIKARRAEAGDLQGNRLSSRERDILNEHGRELNRLEQELADRLEGQNDGGYAFPEDRQRPRTPVERPASRSVFPSAQGLRDPGVSPPAGRVNNPTEERRNALRRRWNAWKQENLDRYAKRTTTREKLNRLGAEYNDSYGRLGDLELQGLDKSEEYFRLLGRVQELEQEIAARYHANRLAQRFNNLDATAIQNIDDSLLRRQADYDVALRGAMDSPEQLRQIAQRIRNNNTGVNFDAFLWDPDPSDPQRRMGAAFIHAAWMQDQSVLAAVELRLGELERQEAIRVARRAIEPQLGINDPFDSDDPNLENGRIVHAARVAETREKHRQILANYINARYGETAEPWKVGQGNYSVDQLREMMRNGDDAALREWARAVYQHENVVVKDGRRMRMLVPDNNIRFTDRNGFNPIIRIEGNIEIWDENTNQWVRAGSSSRSIVLGSAGTSPYIYNGTQFLDEDYQDLGWQSVYNPHAYLWARHAGFEQVKVSAVNQGTYVWGKMGFRDSSPGAPRQLHSLFSGELNKWRNGQQSVIKSQDAADAIAYLLQQTERARFRAAESPGHFDFIRAINPSGDAHNEELKRLVRANAAFTSGAFDLQDDTLFVANPRSSSMNEPEPAPSLIGSKMLPVMAQQPFREGRIDMMAQVTADGIRQNNGAERAAALGITTQAQANDHVKQVFLNGGGAAGLLDLPPEMVGAAMLANSSSGERDRNSVFRTSRDYLAGIQNINPVQIFKLRDADGNETQMGYIIKTASDSYGDGAAEIAVTSVMAQLGVHVEGGMWDGLDRGGRMQIIAPLGTNHLNPDAQIRMLARPGRGGNNYDGRQVAAHGAQGMAQALINFQANFLLGVPDRHNQNAMAYEVDGKPMVFPIDFGFAGSTDRLRAAHDGSLQEYLRMHWTNRGSYDMHKDWWEDFARLKQSMSPAEWSAYQNEIKQTWQEMNARAEAIVDRGRDSFIQQHMVNFAGDRFGRQTAESRLGLVYDKIVRNLDISKMQMTAFLDALGGPNPNPRRYPRRYP